MVAETCEKKLLLLSVGYGQGHHSAAAALAEEYTARGWECRTLDPCAAAHPLLFGISQAYYAFCVRRAPELWAFTYDMTETADWRYCVRWPVLRGATAAVEEALVSFRPSLVICTYPLFAYMLDDIAARGRYRVPYAMVVTDALTISSPWMKSQAPLVFVPDTLSQQQVCDRYGLTADKVQAAGFPVRRAFTPNTALLPPSADDFRIIYACYISKRRSLEQVRAILDRFPQAHLTVLAGDFLPLFRRYFTAELKNGRLTLLHHCEKMPELMRAAHVYIGKAGAATLFECYCTELPMLVNYALPGQEQGNQELMQLDGAGQRIHSTADLMHALQRLSSAQGWSACRQAIRNTRRSGAAARIADAIETRFFS